MITASTFKEFVNVHNADPRHQKYVLRVTSLWYRLTEQYASAPTNKGFKIDVIM